VHFLNRNQVSTPTCLHNPPAGRTYSHLDGTEKEVIRQRLLELQRQRCAYCERRTGDQRDHGHIEHFRDQSGHDHLTLDWNNLFWSCNDEKTCGKHKDKCSKGEGPRRRFEPADLIDPAVDDPETYLLFVADGTVAPRSELDDEARNRATETIRVFHLDECAYLTRAREDVLRPYIRSVNALIALGPEPFRQFIASELQIASEEPFGTAIKHFLTSQAA
jgi:uncharacterized protein (TIGR02646 family)